MAYFKTTVTLTATYYIEASDEDDALWIAYEYLTDRDFDEKEIVEVSREEYEKNVY